MQSTDPGHADRRGGVPRDVAAGLFLLLIAGVAWFGIADLPVGESSGIGPGFVPKGVALLVALFGVIIFVNGLAGDRAPLERLSLRGPLFVLGSIAVFAASIRTLGLAFAGPLTVIIASLADKDSRLVEVAVFALVTTVFCVALFKYILRLPVPLAPMLLGY